MAYKKYVYKNGRKFGPYYCESYRDKNKIKTRFISGPGRTRKIIRNFKKKMNLLIKRIF